MTALKSIIVITWAWIEYNALLLEVFFLSFLFACIFTVDFTVAACLFSCGEKEGSNGKDNRKKASKWEWQEKTSASRVVRRIEYWTFSQLYTAGVGGNFFRFYSWLTEAKFVLDIGKRRTNFWIMLWMRFQGYWVEFRRTHVLLQTGAGIVQKFNHK